MRVTLTRNEMMGDFSCTATYDLPPGGNITDLVQEHTGLTGQPLGAATLRAMELSGVEDYTAAAQLPAGYDITIPAACGPERPEQQLGDSGFATSAKPAPKLYDIQNFFAPPFGTPKSTTAQPTPAATAAPKAIAEVPASPRPKAETDDTTGLALLAGAVSVAIALSLRKIFRKTH